MIRTPNQYRDYFKSLALSLGLDFVYGGSDRILNRQTADLTYPCLWLEIPDMALIRNGGLKRQFHGAFMLLSDAPADGWKEQDDALDACAVWTEKVLQRMYSDAYNHRLFEFDMSGAESTFKARFSADDDWGWHTEFSLIGGACEEPDCCD